ncbi:hypothetical protein CLAIMM_15153 isoform 2 [Cladophialophora immunda]|nr:hypothetical protein CLAIMM_15153 isoform 1 [Cladophialophora immunda]OQV11297.1 hypothetical protein CLAIMM_15153 isoform 2 [Cladophialophora immunda]
MCEALEMNEVWGSPRSREGFWRWKFVYLCGQQGSEDLRSCELVKVVRGVYRVNLEGQKFFTCQTRLAWKISKLDKSRKRRACEQETWGDCTPPSMQRSARDLVPTKF